MGLMEQISSLQPAAACNTAKVLQGMVNAGLETDPLEQMRLFAKRGSRQSIQYGYLKDQGVLQVAWMVDYAPSKMVGHWYGFDHPGVAVYLDGTWYWVFMENWAATLKTLIEQFNKQ